MHAITTASPPIDHLIERATALIPTLRSEAKRIATERSVPAEVMALLQDAELRYLLRPTRYGGAGLDAGDLFRIGRILARGDGSVAWVYFVMALPDILINLFPQEVQDCYWTSPNPSGVASAIPVAPNTGAVRTEGGFLLSGKWGFCSGIDHAGWITIGTSVGMVGEPPRPDRRFLLVPLSDVRIEDDWNVMGMRGTGSKTVAVDNLFVPEDHAITFDRIGTGDADHPDPLYRQSAWIQTSFCISGSGTGVAQAMYDISLDSFRERVGKNDPLFEVRKPIIQSELAEASALIDCSDLLYRTAVEQSFAKLRSGEPLSIEDRVRNRRDQAFSAQLARQATDKLMAMAGARAVVEGHPLQRCFRDMATITTHPGANWAAPSLQYGSVALGGGPLEFMI